MLNLLKNNVEKVNYLRTDAVDAQLDILNTFVQLTKEHDKESWVSEVLLRHCKQGKRPFIFTRKGVTWKLVANSERYSKSKINDNQNTLPVYAIAVINEHPILLVDLLKFKVYTNIKSNDYKDFKVPKADFWTPIKNDNLIWSNTVRSDHALNVMIENIYVTLNKYYLKDRNSIVGLMKRRFSERVNY